MAFTKRYDKLIKQHLHVTKTMQFRTLFKGHCLVSPNFCHCNVHFVTLSYHAIDSGPTIAIWLPMLKIRIQRTTGLHLYCTNQLDLQDFIVIVLHVTWTSPLHVMYMTVYPPPLHPILSHKF